MRAGREEAVAFLNPMATTVEDFGHPRATGRFPVRCLVKDGKPS